MWPRRRRENQFVQQSSLAAFAAAVVVAGTIAVGGHYVGRAARVIRTRSKPSVSTQGGPAQGGIFSWGKTFYTGGFEAKMDRKEASRILGCRANSTSERITNRYRTLMRLNHPDLGGSPFLTMKVNEAKELLLQTARSEKDK